MNFFGKIKNYFRDLWEIKEKPFWSKNFLISLLLFHFLFLFFSFFLNKVRLQVPGFLLIAVFIIFTTAVVVLSISRQVSSIYIFIQIFLIFPPLVFFRSTFFLMDDNFFVVMFLQFYSFLARSFYLYFYILLVPVYLFILLFFRDLAPMPRVRFSFLVIILFIFLFFDSVWPTFSFRWYIYLQSVYYYFNNMFHNFML